MRPLVLLGPGGVEILGDRPADPALDRAEEVEPGQAHELAHRLLDAGRMAARGQPVGDLLVPGPLAFEQHAVEIENEGIELHWRGPNKAVPTRTWVAPIITALS